MLKEKSISSSIAKIEVQQIFCNNCSVSIKKELQKIKDLNNIMLYPKRSLITFNFIKANNLSTVLNTLSEIGYSEKGEQINTEQYLNSTCCTC